MPDKAVRMWPRTSSEEASRHVKNREWERDEQTDRQSSRQHNIGCITMTFSVQYSRPACWYVGAGDCGTMRTRRVLQSKYYTREYCCHDKGEEEGERERWRGLSNDREAVLQLKEKKRVYPFAVWGERWNNRWVSCLQFSAPNQTSSEITLYSQ